MIAFLKELPTVWKITVSFVGGFATAVTTVWGLVVAPVRDHETRIQTLEVGNRVMVCWVRAQIAGADAQGCLFLDPERQ